MVVYSILGDDNSNQQRLCICTTSTYNVFLHVHMCCTALLCSTSRYKVYACARVRLPGVRTDLHTLYALPFTYLLIMTSNAVLKYTCTELRVCRILDENKYF